MLCLHEVRKDSDLIIVRRDRVEGGTEGWGRGHHIPLHGKIVETQGKVSVLAGKAVETQGKGSA